MGRIVLGLALVALLAACSIEAAAPPPAEVVAVVLDDLHEAASLADGDRYFAQFAPDAVFFGTDETERWTLEEFRAYASARFERGDGWTYRVTGRHVFVSADANTAWFDETLHNEKYGACRGTGVLVKGDGAWKITQYNLTIPIPNEIALDVVQMIRRQSKAREAQ